MIIKRCQNIKSGDDFLEDERGLEVLDMASLRLSTIGEGIKQIDHLMGKSYLLKYESDTYWKGIKGIRDIISHQYFNIDVYAIFDACKHGIHDLYDITRKIKNDVEENSF